MDLPIENIVEKEFGSKSKKDIEAIGVDKFNEMCRSKVSQYVEDWKVIINRLGRWADMENSYKTMDLIFGICLVCLQRTFGTRFDLRGLPLNVCLPTMRKRLVTIRNQRGV